MKVEVPFLAAVALAGVAAITGKALIKHIRFLQRLHLPEPLVGGLLFASLLWFVREGGLQLELPTQGAEVDFLVALITTNMGLHITLPILKNGFPVFITFLFAAVVLYFVQLGLVLPFALLSEFPLETAILTGPLSFLGAPFNLNPPAQTAPLEGLFQEAYPRLKDQAQGMMMMGVVLGGLLSSFLASYFVRRSGQQPPKPSPSTSQTKMTLTAFGNDLTNLLVLILVLVCLSFGLQRLLFEVFPALKEDYLPIILISYLLGACARLLFSAAGKKKLFPKKALTVLLLGPTMNLVLTYALMSVPLHKLALVQGLWVPAGLLSIAGSALLACLLFPLLKRLTNSYYAAVIATAFFTVTTGWGPVGMLYLRRFMDEEGPVEPMPVVLPANAFFLLPWIVILLSEMLLIR